MKNKLSPSFLIQKEQAFVESSQVPMAITLTLQQPLLTKQSENNLAK